MIEVDEDSEVRDSRTLRRVIPVAQMQSSDTLAITLYSIEDYAAGFTIRGELLGLKGHPVRELDAARIEAQQALLQAKLKELRHAPPNLNVAPMIAAPDSEASRAIVATALWPTPAWKTRDDRGNTYEARQWGGTSSSPGGFPVEYSFAPAITQEARWLIFETPEVAWTSLPPNDEPPIWVDRGPWVFRIDLGSGLAVRRSTVGGV